MKKYLLLVAVLFVTIGSFAQKGKVTSALTLIEQGNLDKPRKLLIRL